MNNDVLMTLKKRDDKILVEIIYENYFFEKLIFDYYPKSNKNAFCDSINCLSINDFRLKLEKSETPTDFIKKVSDDAAENIIFEPDKRYYYLSRMFTSCWFTCIYCQNYNNKQLLKRYNFDHYIFISIDDLQDPKEYLNSMYAVFDNWGLFDKCQE